MTDDYSQASIKPVERPINLIPVGLKEAALDSPTFRATALHFSDQIDIIERWLEGYVKATVRLITEVSSLEGIVNAVLVHSLPPSQVSEAVLDHDYTMLAMQRYGESAREFWQHTLGGIKKGEKDVVDPIKGFLGNELQSFKNARKMLDSSQKTFDSILARCAALGKNKEPSSLREDAFQLHEARRAYLKAGMDFSVTAPQVRNALDKLLVRIFSEQWKEMKTSREAHAATFTRWNAEMERVKGWSKEMENSERVFKRELTTARKQIEESAEAMTRPSRHLEDYEVSTVPYIGASAVQTPAKLGPEKAEKQGWLFLRSITGKPARTVWPRRWFFVKNGIFGWLIQGARSGGVEESDRTGVLLCSIRPAFQEERRFCFEVKTKDTSVILQAETQTELTEWIAAFEVAKRKALEDPASTEISPASPGVDPAFAISPPIAPEFAAKVGEGHAQQGSEDASGALGIQGGEISGLAPRSSFDVASSRRPSGSDRDGDGGRDHAARIMQKLDIHKRSSATPQLNPAPAGGIASLISASHNILPVGPGAPPPSAGLDKRTSIMLTCTLAPSTLANPPAPTNLSHTAVVVSGERGVGLGRSDGSGMPSGIMANLWGSSNWGYVNRLERNERLASLASSTPASPALKPVATSANDSGMAEVATKETSRDISPGVDLSLSPTRALHRKSISLNTAIPSEARRSSNIGEDEFPKNYPLPLKTQQAQFRMLFPSVPRAEKVVLVFRATWNPTDQQEFPGRVYVTAKEIYFYSNHLGLVLITGVRLTSVSEVTAARGRDCDFIYLHLTEKRREVDARRITIKTFLEPLKLLQRRLNFLVHNASSDDAASLDEVLSILIRMESEKLQRSSSVESWEELSYSPDENNVAGAVKPGEQDVKASLRIDGNLYGDTAGVRTGREVQKFKLPSQPVQYAPQGLTAAVVREFNVSAKALFHVVFGDKSAVFQMLYCNRWASNVVQTPWSRTSDDARWMRRFTSPESQSPFTDLQSIDIMNEHLCYVVTNHKTPWRLPYSKSFQLTSKMVITHVAKSRCKLAIYQQVTWVKQPSLGLSRRLIERQALNDLQADAIDLSTVANDQVVKLGSYSKTNKAVQIFGDIGQHALPAQMDGSSAPPLVAISPTSAKRIRRRTLLSLYADEAFAQLFRLFTTMIDLIVVLGKGVISMCTSHTLLVVLLSLSVLYNTLYGYRDTLLWYQDRSAARFMGRLGVVPMPVMSKAIYLADINDLVAPTLDNSTALAFGSDFEQKSCRTTFHDQLLTPAPLPSQRSAVRLQRTRNSLAQYRHDLLVAMRVVNRVERDIVLAEWEEWVKEEDSKCAKVEAMIQQVKSGKKVKASGRKNAKAGLVDGELEIELGEEFAAYCRSCRAELEGIESWSAPI